jgi:hypothetical protein
MIIDKLFLTVGEELERGILLVVDAYYASLTVLRPLLGTGHHILTRVRCNAVAYYPAPQSTPRRRGRPQVYGQKVRLPADKTLAKDSVEVNQTFGSSGETRRSPRATAMVRAFISS